MRHPRPQWSGFYYDGRTAQRHAVVVTVEPDGLTLHHADGSTVHWPFALIRQTQGAVGAEQLRLEFGGDPPEVLLVQQPGLREAVQEIAPDAFSHFRNRSRTARVVAWSLGGLAIATALYLWGMPIVARAVAEVVPVSWERRLGARVVQEMAPAERRCTDTRGVASLRVVVDRLARAIPSSPYDFRVYVARDPMVNAFAAPGGYIVINSGLLTTARSAEELAGVLAHEMQHVLQRHTTRAIIRAAPLQFALSTFSSGGFEAAGNVVATLGMLHFSRANEVEADREGMRLLSAAQVDPTAVVSFLESLDSQDSEAPRLVSYLSSHPRTADRVAMLDSMATSTLVTARPILDEASWRRLQMICADSTTTLAPPPPPR